MTLVLTLTALVLVHGLFVAVEYAIVKLAYADKTAVQTASQSNRTLSIFKHLDDYLTLCQLAKTVVLLVMGLFIGLALSSLSMDHSIASVELGWDQLSWFLLGFVGIVIVQTILGFELPRRIGVARSDRCTNTLGKQLILCRWLLWPLLVIINRLKKLLTSIA